MEPGFDSQAVIYRDFDFNLDEPGVRSGAALDALHADLGVRAEDGDATYDEWPDRLHGVISHGLPALLARLAHPDVSVRRVLAVVLAYVVAEAESVVPALRARSESEPDAATRLGLLVALGRHAADGPAGARALRDYLRDRMRRDAAGSDAFGAAISLTLHAGAAEIDDEVLDGLALCPGPAGTVLAELAWCDPEWAGRAPRGPVDTVDSWLYRTPDLRAAWLSRMTPGLWNGAVDASVAPVLVRAADELFKKDRERFSGHASAVAALLRHPDPRVRRAAVVVSALPAHQEYMAALVDALDDAEVSDRALNVLARRGDPRCVPHVRRMIRQGVADRHDGWLVNELFRSVARFADELWPQVRLRLAEDPTAAEVSLLLNGAWDWGPGGRVILPEVAATLERLGRRIGATERPARDDLEAAATAACSFLGKQGLDDERALSVLRQVAAGPDLEIGLAAIRALMGLGEPADDEIVRLLLDVLARCPPPGRDADRYGWRFDSNACAWLSELGPRARSAAPALRALRDAKDAHGQPRVDSAYALWRITGDADEALPLLIEHIPRDPMRTLDHLGSMETAARPALPVLRELAEGDSDLARRARSAVARIEPHAGSSSQTHIVARLRTARDQPR